MLKPGDEASNITLINRGGSRVMLSDLGRRAQRLPPRADELVTCEVLQNNDCLQRQ